jgi:hypothetical protein
MAIGRAGCLWSLRFVLIGPIEGMVVVSWMEPEGGDVIDLQGFEGNGTKDLVEIGRKEGIEDVSQR